jgi:hypothetical protein
VIGLAKLLTFWIGDQQWRGDLVDYIGEVVLAGGGEDIKRGLQTVRLRAPLLVLPLGRRRFLHPFFEESIEVLLVSESSSCRSSGGTAFAHGSKTSYTPGSAIAAAMRCSNASARGTQ